ncbi:MAG: FAD-dependent thymidylate synthase [Phycisphaerales bacterium]
MSSPHKMSPQPSDAAQPSQNPDAADGMQSAVREVRPESPMVDVMGGALRREVKVLDHGFIALVDAMPRLVPMGATADQAIVQAARVSYGAGTKQINEDRGLIRYLMRHRHSTPFEMVEFKFHVAMPIFVARQWIRHRTANVNEYSARYSIVQDRFYIPTADAVRKQSQNNRQGGEQVFASEDAAQARTAEDFLRYVGQVETLYAQYRALTEQGVSRELARIGLPVNVYTEWYWKCDLHNVLRFLALRLDAHAQYEIRVYAQAMLDLITPIVPMTIEAWRDYELGAMHLSRLEVEALAAAIGSGGIAGIGEIRTENKREQAEWDAKRKLLGTQPQHEPDGRLR